MLETPADIERAARFDRPDHFENLGRIDLGNGAAPDGRKDVTLHPVQDSLGVGRIEPFDTVGVPSPGDRLEQFERGPLFLPLLLDLCWVFSLIEQRLCLVPFLAGERQGDDGILPEAQQLFLALEAVFEAPEL